MRLLALLLLPVFVLAQNPKTAIYPGAAGDKDLGVQVNKFQTTLSADMSSSATTVSLATTAGLRNYTYLGIDNEYMLVCNVVDGSTVQIGKSSCPNGDGRGLDGTSAAAHISAGGTKAVAAYLVAGQFNQVAAEIKAIEASPRPAEPPLGNPATDGQVLASTMAGTRSWTSKAAPGACSTNQFAVGTTVSGVACLVVNWNMLAGVPSSFAPGAHAPTHAQGAADPVTLSESQVTNLTADLAAKAPTADPVFTGKVKVGTTVVDAVAGVIVPMAVANTSPASPAATGFYVNNAGAVTYNLPAITSTTVGLQMCFRNAAGNAGVMTIKVPAGTVLDLNGANGGGAGTLVSGGALGDSACVVAQGIGQYLGYPGNGTWTNH